MITTYPVAAAAAAATTSVMYAHVTLPGDLGPTFAGETISLSIAPILHPKDGAPNPASRTFWSATANALYIVRQRGSDLFGPTPDLADWLRQGSDLVDHGRRGPIGCDADTLAGVAL